MSISGEPRLAGVLGWPIAHSRSPRIHGHWIERYGIDGAYLPLAVKPEDFERVVRALPCMGFRGCNVTLPHKQAALALADDVDATARAIGAANTLSFLAGNRIQAANTDAFGFLAHLEASRKTGTWRARPTMVLGAGGAARAIVYALLNAGLPEVRVANRTRERSDRLRETFGPRVVTIPWGDREAALDGCGLLTNTTSLGMHGQPPLQLALDPLPLDAVVYDIVYVPLETDLLSTARRRGNPVVDGLGMLLHQARPGFAHWFGVEPEVTARLREELLRDIAG